MHVLRVNTLYSCIINIPHFLLFRSPSLSLFLRVTGSVLSASWRYGGLTQAACTVQNIHSKKSFIVVFFFFFFFFSQEEIKYPCGVFVFIPKKKSKNQTNHFYFDLQFIFSRTGYCLLVVCDFCAVQFPQNMCSPLIFFLISSLTFNTFAQASGVINGGHLYPMVCPPTAGDPDVVTCQRWPDISIIIVNRAW